MSGDELDEADEMELGAVGVAGVPAVRMDAFEITARARRAYAADGRLALPPQAGWPIFPFETEGLRMRGIEDPVLPEPSRRGEGGAPCWTCTAPDEEFLWSDDGWLVSMAPEPLSVPALTLHPRAHLDFDDLTEDQGAQLGVLLVRAQRALGGIPGVGRVHVYKWGDGGAHLHLFLVARPLGMMQLRGMYLSTWMHALPPMPAEQWQAVVDHVAAALAVSAAG